jgi:hypothetical protein
VSRHAPDYTDGTDRQLGESRPRPSAQPHDATWPIPLSILIHKSKQLLRETQSRDRFADLFIAKGSLPKMVVQAWRSGQYYSGQNARNRTYRSCMSSCPGNAHRGRFRSLSRSCALTHLENSYARSTASVGVDPPFGGQAALKPGQAPSAQDPDLMMRRSVWAVVWP